jgi:hypothetical protein
MFIAIGPMHDAAFEPSHHPMQDDAAGAKDRQRGKDPRNV